MVQRRDREYILTISPFFDSKEIKTKSRLTPLSYNEEEDYYITKKVIYKSEEYVKTIIEKEINITEYYKLSNLAKTLLFYIINSKLEYNSLTFHLDVNTFTTIIGHTGTNKIYDAINSLIKFRYIARTDKKELYWINHNKFYKGNYLVIKNIEQ